MPQVPHEPKEVQYNPGNAEVYDPDAPGHTVRMPDYSHTAALGRITAGNAISSPQPEAPQIRMSGVAFLDAARTELERNGAPYDADYRMLGEGGIIEIPEETRPLIRQVGGLGGDWKFSVTMAPQSTVSRTLHVVDRGANAGNARYLVVEDRVMQARQFGTRKDKQPTVEELLSLDGIWPFRDGESYNFGRSDGIDRPGVIGVKGADQSISRNSFRMSFEGAKITVENLVPADFTEIKVSPHVDQH